MKKINDLSLRLLELLERPNGTKRLGYKSVRKAFDVSFIKVYGYSPYDYAREWKT